MGNEQSAKSVLKKIFGYDEFRPHQQEIVDYVLEGRDGFVVMPTGGGKSLCFQLPAHMKIGTCIVVSPLISLMKDQVDSAAETGLRAACLNSSMSPAVQGKVLRDLRSSQLDLLYVAPERFGVRAFEDALHDAEVSFFAIDEAHCISEWGHDFRPDYAQLSRLVPSFPGVSVVAFTATATPQVQRDIIARLALRRPFQVRASFDRPNLFYSVTPKRHVDAQVLEFIHQHPDQSGIIYRATRKAVDETSEFLRMNNVNVAPYHAGMSDADRARNQEAFRRDEVRVVVATVAFGMGIDKPNVRWVVHADLPKNLESYYQETGRAGRDGDPAHCQLFFSSADAAKIEYFISQASEVDEQKRLRTLLRSMMEYARGNACRRRTLLSYFGEQHEIDKCGGCDVCKGDVDTVDASVEAQKLLSAILRSGQKFGAGQVVDIVTGASTERIRRYGHDKLPTYGVGGDKPKSYWKQLVGELESQKCLRRSSDQYPTLSLTRLGREVLKGNKEFRVLDLTVKNGERARPVMPELNNWDAALFEQLRGWRKKWADELDVPAYVVFGDRVLRHIAIAKPETSEELKRISGVGEYKCAKFGPDLLDRITAFLDAHPDARTSTHPAQLEQASGLWPEAAATFQLTWQMFSNGMEPEEIAQKRGLATGTIVSHLEKGVDRGCDFDLSRLVSPEVLAEVDKIMNELGDERLGPVVEKGDGRFGYEEAKIVRCMRNSVEAV
jgi:ATP-dependent DNA helicase RecQ